MNTVKEAEERVFFVSARETLQGRLHEANGQPAHNGALAEGFQSRYFEFQDFERKFEECISKSAVKTKFEQHSSRGKTISNDMRAMLDSIFERINDLRNQKLEQKKFLTDRISNTETQLMVVTREMKMKIHNMVEEVEQKVSKALNEEIWRLSVLVDEFNLPFHTDALVLNVYKKEMNGYVENGLGSNLRARLSTALAMNIETAQREMTDRMTALVPKEKLKEQTSQIITARSQPFEMLYTLNCQNLCSDFQETLEFRFSWGITALIQRFNARRAAGKGGGKAIKYRNNGNLNVRTNLRHHRWKFLTQTFSDVASDDTDDRPELPDDADAAVRRRVHDRRAAFFNFAHRSRLDWIARNRRGTHHRWNCEKLFEIKKNYFLILANLFQLFKTIGWRVLVGVGGIYLSVYAYERLSWTNKAKERKFKEQYVRHATRKLKLIVDLTSANCSHQVQQ